MNRIRSMILGGLTLVCASGAAVSEPITNAEEGWAALQKCAALLDDRARHRCSDDVMRDGGLTPKPEMKAAEQRKRFGLTESVPAAKQEEAELAVTLTKVEKALDGKLVLTTSDGAVWKQIETESDRQEPAAGQAMTISKTLFGGYMCKPLKRVAFRCSRTR